MKTLAWLSVALLVGACAVSPAPADRYLRLAVPPPAALDAGSALALEIVRLGAAGVVNERSLLYARSTSPLLLEQHPYLLWAQPPAELVEDELRRYLVASAAFVPVPAGAGELQLRGRLLRFEQQLDAAAPAVTAELELQLSRDGRPLLATRYAARVGSDSNRPQDVAVALSAALADIFARFVDDARVASRP